MARKNKPAQVDPAEVERLGAELLERHAEVTVDTLDATVEEDLARATTALAEGRLVEALFACAWALWLEPEREDLLELLDRILAEGVKRKVELPPRDAAPGPLFTAIVAHATWWDGDHAGALELLDEAALEDEELPFAAAWLPRWLDDDHALRDLEEAGLSRLGSLAAGAAEALETGEDDEPDERFLALAERAERVLELDRVQDAALSDLLVDALAAAGRPDDAVALAREVLVARGDVAAKKALAVALRRAGQHEDAVASFLDAHAADPGDLGCLLDAAGLRLEQERWKDALELYERVLAKEPHPWAVPSAQYCRWRLGDAAALDELRASASGGDDDDEPGPGLLEGLMSKGPQQAMADLMAMFAHPAGQDRERARALLARIPGELEPED